MEVTGSTNITLTQQTSNLRILALLEKGEKVDDAFNDQNIVHKINFANIISIIIVFAEIGKFRCAGKK